MSGDWRLPDGFRVVETHRSRLIVHEALQEAFSRAGLDEAAGWESGLDSSAEQSGRGASQVREIGGELVRLKQLRRGGRAAGLRGERFRDRRRLLENLSLPIEALARGIPTAAPRALLVESGEGSGYRGWLATEELQGMQDAAALVRCEPDRADPRWLPTVDLIRKMHDAGIEHRDLNLGNLMVGVADRCRSAIIDFDGARMHDAPLSFRLRQRALRRLERSYVKLRHPEQASESTRTQIYARYAANDRELTRRLRRGRRWGRCIIGWHRLGWPGK